MSARLIDSGSGEPVAKRWPFVETPGEFAARMSDALMRFDLDMLAACRHCLIEFPAKLAAPPKREPLVDAIARLLPVIERQMKDYVFTAERAGEVAADMNTLRAAALDARAAIEQCAAERDALLAALTNVLKYPRGEYSESDGFDEAWDAALAAVDMSAQRAAAERAIKG